jgi:hypothetical protein
MYHTLKVQVNLTKSIIAFVISAFFLVYGFYFLFTSLWLEAAVFIVIGLAFSVVVYLYGSTVVVSPEGVSLRFLFINRLTLKWSDIKEVGVIGENIFNQGNKKKTGMKYIYFSDKAFTEKERFQLGVNWPPRHMPYMIYSEERAAVIQYLWDKKFALYNVEDLDIYTPMPSVRKEKDDEESESKPSQPSEKDGKTE